MLTSRREYIPIKVGDVFGRLTVIGELETHNGRGYYICQCSCGSDQKEVRRDALLSSAARSCGCLQRELTSTRQTSDLTGKRYGRLAVIYKATRKAANGGAYYHCQCDCGNTKEVRGDTLTDGSSKSCGCLNYEVITTHGLTLSCEYRAWAGMKTRCNNPANHKYPSYGGRGIKVCDAWSDSFETFLKDMGNRPSTDHSIDRIDSNEGYHPLNCRWATISDQNTNRHGYLGQHHTISPGVFTTTKAIINYLYDGSGSDSTYIAGIYATYRRETNRSNFFQYCKDTIPNFDESACVAYLEKHKGIYLIEDLKNVEV